MISAAGSFARIRNQQNYERLLMNQLNGAVVNITVAGLVIKISHNNPTRQILGATDVYILIAAA